jgi:hypothetical protein
MLAARRQTRRIETSRHLRGERDGSQKGTQQSRRGLGDEGFAAIRRLIKTGVTGKTIAKEIGRSVVALYQKASIEGISLSSRPTVRRSAVGGIEDASCPLNVRRIFGRQLEYVHSLERTQWGDDSRTGIKSLGLWHKGSGTSSCTPRGHGRSSRRFSANREKWTETCRWCRKASRLLVRTASPSILI